jgi:hypothetical protein
MNARSRFHLALGLAAVGLLVGCEEMPQAIQRPLSAFMPTPSGWWQDNGTHGAPKIVVHLSEQKAYFYKGKTLVGESTI